MFRQEADSRYSEKSFFFLMVRQKSHRCRFLYRATMNGYSVEKNSFGKLMNAINGNCILQFARDKWRMSHRLIVKVLVSFVYSCLHNNVYEVYSTRLKKVQTTL